MSLHYGRPQAKVDLFKRYQWLEDQTRVPHLGTVLSLTEQMEEAHGTPFLVLKPSPGTSGRQERRPRPSEGASAVLRLGLRVQEARHTQPYSYHTVCWSPPGSGDAGMLFELFPRLKSSGARLVWGAKSGDLPGLLAGSPSLWACPGTPSPSERLSPTRTGAMVATSPECWGVGGLVRTAGAGVGERCWG